MCLHVTDSASTRKWLRDLVVLTEQVTLVWDKNTALSVPWDIFIMYWDDFCYPGCDNVAIHFDRDRSQLVCRPDEVFEFWKNML